MTTITVSGTTTGDSGADIFVFAPGSGADTITNFSDAKGDKIDLTGFAGLTDFAYIQSHAVQSGSDTVITLGSDSLTLQNVVSSSLTASDFITYAPTNVTTDQTITASQTFTFTGSSGGLGAYDLHGPVDLTLDGAMQFQDGWSNDNLVGVQTQGTSGPPGFVIAAGATMSLSAQGSNDTACGFYASVNAGFENDGILTVSATANASAVILNAGGLFTNKGTITAASSGGVSYGVAAGDNVGGVSIIENTGTITAQYAINAITGSGYMVVDNSASGTINGQVVLGPAAGNAVSNAGHINGSVIFDGTTGQQTYDGRGGALSGGVAFASGANITGTDYAYLGNDGETARGGSATFYAYGGAGADHITGGSGDSFIDGGGGDDVLEGGGSASTTLTGGLGADTFAYRPGDGNVTVTDFSDAQGDKVDLSGAGITSLSDVLAASSQVGADTVITVGAGSLTLQNVSTSSLTASDFRFFTPAATVTGTAANGFTATFEGVYRQYTVSPGRTAVTGGPEGASDSLANINRIQFVDGYLATSPTDTAGQVYRVYEATLGRAPDQEGLTNWVHQLNAGASLQSVVDGFVNSPEFQATYGANLSNSDFVTLLYHNVLHRDPDQAGLQNWVANLNGGETRAQVVTGFSESPEDIAALAAPVQQGLWIGDAAAAQVARLYDTVFGRLPDPSGLANWTHTLESGSSLQSVANGFVGSTEFQTAYGALNNNDFVTLLYHNVLHRDPDPTGLQSWVANLNGGETRAQVVVGFSESAEHISNTAAHIDSGIWIAS